MPNLVGPTGLYLAVFLLLSVVEVFLVCVAIFYLGLARHLVDQNGGKEVIPISVGLELRILCARHNIREDLGTHAYKPQYVNCRRNGD
jgi:hypothetical protein